MIRTFGTVTGITNQPLGLDVGAGINTGDATAGAPDILAPKTAYGPLGKITGSMVEQGSPSLIPVAAGVVLAAGHVAGGGIPAEPNFVAGKIPVGTSMWGLPGTYTNDANAIAADILTGKTAYVNGVKLAGTSTAKRVATGTGTIDSSGNAVVAGLAFQPSIVIIDTYINSTRDGRQTHWTGGRNANLSKAYAYYDFSSLTWGGGGNSGYTCTPNASGFTFVTSGALNQPFSYLAIE